MVSNLCQYEFYYLYPIVIVLTYKHLYFIFFHFLGGGGSDNEQLMKQAGLAVLAVAVMYYLSVQGRYRLF